MSPNSDDIEAQVGCGPWASNRSSMVLENPQLLTPAPHKIENHEALDKALRAVQYNLESPSQVPSAPTPPPGNYQSGSSSVLKRHHSLPHQNQARSMDNIGAVARTGGPISSRTRRAQAHGVRQYETPDEEDELLHEALKSTHKANKKLERQTNDVSHSHRAPPPPPRDSSLRESNRQPLRQSNSNVGVLNPYPTPSPSASGNAVLFGGSNHSNVTSIPLNIGQSKRSTDPNAASSNYKWPTPPYEENEWAASAAASIWAVGNRF